MLIPLTGKSDSSSIIKIGRGHVMVTYDRRGRLRLVRQAKGRRKPPPKPGKDETVFRVRSFDNGESTFKSAAGNCGYLSVNGSVYWGSIWDDDDNEAPRSCTFQEWVDECARKLAGEEKEGKKTGK